MSKSNNNIRAGFVINRTGDKRLTSAATTNKNQIGYSSKNNVENISTAMTRQARSSNRIFPDLGV